MTGLSMYDRIDRGRRRRRGAIVLVLVLLLGGGLLAWWLLRPVPDDPRVAAAQLGEAWSAGALDEVPFTGAPDDLGERYTTLVEGLAADEPSVGVVAVEDPAADEDPRRTTATLQVTWTLDGHRRWAYETQAVLVRPEDSLSWEVTWDPSLVHPDLEDGLVLRARRLTPTRGDVLAADGTPLVTAQEVVDVGIQPGRMDDAPEATGALVDAVADALEQVEVPLDREALAARIEEAGSDAFVPVVTLRADDYLRVQEDVQPLPGTVFRRREQPLAPTADFARFTLGSVREVTAEMLEEQPDRYAAGDRAGRGGVQQVHDERLFGTPGLEVVLAGEEAPDDPVLFREDPEPGEPVTITLDERVQRAADAAVQGTDHATALAVVRTSDGHVVALANSDEATSDIARQGSVPPGSTFKVVTTHALLTDTDLAPDTTIDCPNQTTVGGRTITNAEDQELGTVDFRTAFVNSCNTAFVQLSQDLDPGALQAAAARLGVGATGSIGIGANLGEVPETGDAVDLAATAIGQGRTLVSPLAMAGVAAAVANGSFPGLSLVLEPAPDDPVEAGDPLPEGQAALLQELMRGVVTDGTGTVLADTPGGPVQGKTGTAEFGDGEGNLRTHAWFLGFQGDLAFAVVVTDTDGAYGGQVAAPVAGRLLTTLAEAS